MWSFVVALPAVQTDFGVARGEASLPFTLTMIGFGAGGIVMGRLADRFGVIIPIVAGAVFLGAGFVLSGMAANLWQFALAQGLIGLGSSGSFGPIMSDISHWFVRRRGIAVAHRILRQLSLRRHLAAAGAVLHRHPGLAPDADGRRHFLRCRDPAAVAR